MEINFDPQNPLCENNILEAMPTLFQAETRYMAVEGYSKKSNILSHRNEAMRIIKQYARSCFLESVIPFLAVNYFDRFVSRKPLVLVGEHQENLQLFTTCCFLIAWKMRSLEFFPSEFLIEQELNFKMERILKMELQILEELKWCTRPVNALCFLDFFIGCFELTNQYKEDLKYYATEKIYKNQYDITYTEFKPSIIAASALLFSFALHLRANLSDFKQAVNAICSCRYIEPESLYHSMPKSIGEEWLKHILTSRSISQANVAAASAHGLTLDTTNLPVSPPHLSALDTTTATVSTTEPKIVIDSTEEKGEQPTDESRPVSKESTRVAHTPTKPGKKVLAEESQRDMES